MSLLEKKKVLLHASPRRPSVSYSTKKLSIGEQLYSTYSPISPLASSGQLKGGFCESFLLLLVVLLKQDQTGPGQNYHRIIRIKMIKR